MGMPNAATAMKYLEKLSAKLITPICSAPKVLARYGNVISGNKT